MLLGASSPTAKGWPSGFTWWLGDVGLARHFVRGVYVLICLLHLLPLFVPRNTFYLDIIPALWGMSSAVLQP